MGSVFDVAKYILEEKETMSTMKLQKLCYYSQAWSIAWTEKPLFNEEFQAWVNGPVCYELFDKHRGQYWVSEDTFSGGDCHNLSPDEIDTINIVLNHYGDMDPYALREQTHSEAPWIIARGDRAPDEPCSTIISKDSMGLYYGGL